MPQDHALYPLLIFITDIGDSALLTLLVMSGSLFLLMRGCRREAFIFACSLLVTGGLMALFKILVLGCGSDLRAWGLRSPSGHSALSIAVLGTLALLLRSRMETHRNLPLLILLPLAFTIALSRAVIGVHSKEEVFAGMIIGSAVLLACNHVLARKVASRFNPYPLLWMAILIAVLAHGWHLPAEQLIHVIAGHFKTAAKCI